MKATLYLNFHLETDIDLFNLKVTPSMVAKFIHRLELSKATGPDEIPVEVLKNHSAELSPVLSKLFNKCIRQACFPNSWKRYSVCPIFKNSGERCDPSKYRPISLLSIISKVFESVINDYLVVNLESLPSYQMFNMASSPLVLQQIS